MIRLYEEIKKQAADVTAELCEKAKLREGQILVVGCSSSIIIEQAAVPDAEFVNVVPQPKAGGSFATTAYHTFEHPVALEEIKADAGIDIGDTFIGMHLKRVAVPVRLTNHEIGEAHITAARVRPKFIGGERAHYDAELL